MSQPGWDEVSPAEAMGWGETDWDTEAELRAEMQRDWDDHPIRVTGDLALFLGGSADSFTGQLLNLIEKADLGNRGRLKLAFPREALAWEQWQSCSPAPTFGQMREMMAELEPMIRQQLDMLGRRG